MKKREPILLKNLPEPLKTFAYYNMSCSHFGEGTTEDNPLIYPDVIFSDWSELAENINNFLAALEKKKILTINHESVNKNRYECIWCDRKTQVTCPQCGGTGFVDEEECEQ